MNYSAPKSFYFKGMKKQAVLLLHSFTGSTIDMRKLGRFLNKENYTVYAPMYSGHGEEAFELLKFGPEDWWENVREAYEFLEDEGYEEIVVIGLSLGAILALKVALELEPSALITMSMPTGRDEVTLRKRVVYYAKRHQQYEDKTEAEKERAIEQLKVHPMEIVTQFVALIDEQMRKIEQISIPTLAMYGDLDEPLYADSARYFIDHIRADVKAVKHYERASHLMTYSKDAEKIHVDILNFLEELECSLL